MGLGSMTPSRGKYLRTIAVRPEHQELSTEEPWPGLVPVVPGNPKLSPS